MAAVALLALVWLAGSMGGSGTDSWIRPVGGPRGPVRILQFYATTGMLVAGEKAKLCYGVENARAVHISPRLAGVVPSANRCLEIVPERTTHYTILAEGFDGALVTRFLTLVVEEAPDADRGGLNVARLTWDRPSLSWSVVAANAGKLDGRQKAIVCPTEHSCGYGVAEATF
ncbi:MAG: hypothetical protein ABSH40_08225 [Bryobacteraceae bacterium]